MMIAWAMMLNIGQLLRQKTDVVIVDQSDGSHDVQVERSDCLEIPVVRGADPETPQSDLHNPGQR